MEDTVLNYVRRYNEEFNWWLFAEGDQHVLVPDLDEIAALSPRRKELWDRANGSTFITENEKREMVGYDTVGEEGDVILVPASMVPLDQVTNPVDESLDEPPAKPPKKPVDDAKKDEDLDDEAYGG
jgi:hypothetical protein